MEHIDKIKNEITEKGGLTTDEIAAKFLGIKNPSPINKKLVENIFKNYPQIYYENEKWRLKLWEKAQFSTEDFEKEPQSFGVFGFYDENKKIIFVGSAKNLREKLLSLDNKELFESAVSYITSPSETEEKMLETERKLIAKHQPILNLL
jgi:hypothetical protein